MTRVRPTRVSPRSFPRWGRSHSVLADAPRNPWGAVAALVRTDVLRLVSLALASGWPRRRSRTTYRRPRSASLVGYRARARMADLSLRRAVRAKRALVSHPCAVAHAGCDRRQR